MRTLRVVVLGLVSLSVLLGAVSVRPAQAHTGTYRVNGGNGLRLREGPGAEFHIITVMPHNSLVTAMGHRGNWMKVRYNGIVGWAFITYLVPAGGNTSAGSGSTTSGFCMVNFFGEWSCASANVINAIRYWAGQYGIGWWWLAATSACESAFRDVVNPISGVTGWFQFQPSTFWAWGGRDIHDIWDQSRIASKMFAAGQARQFYCAVLIGYA